jgi:hypothetical protein
MQNMAAAITRLQATTDALGALGARLSIGEGDTVRDAGCQDVHSLTRTWPVPVGYVVGQKA